MASLEAIERVSALSRIEEIQQRIREIQQAFGTTTPENKFQKVLETEMERIKPIEQFLAENQLPPVREPAPPANTEPETVVVTPIRESQGRVENAAPTTTEGMIEAAARRYGVESELVKAIATAESNLDQTARSYVGAIGVMQLMPETAESLGVDPYDEKQNIEGGAHYIRQMLDKFNGNVKHAIAAYNAGPGAVQRYGGIPPYSETQNYVGRVMDFYVG